jgi:serine/threonine protein phosphatase PrpC
MSKLAKPPHANLAGRRICQWATKGDNVTSFSGVEFAILTDVGMRRTTNQDSQALLTADSPSLLESRGHLLMVADGMGAHAAGELASRLAIEQVPHLYRKYTELSPPEALLRAFREANTEINRRGTANTDFHNMGTTSSVLVLLPQGAIAGHVGDSRVYRLRDHTISQLTFDHSLQWELKASGQLPDNADISAVVPKNVITRSLGPNASVQIDLEGPHKIAVGDVYLLCSDGLTGRVEDQEIGAILASLPPKEAAHALVDLANLRGGPDNVTVLIGKVTGPELVAKEGTTNPLRMGASQILQPLHIVLLIVALVCGLAAGMLAFVSHLVAALVVLGVGAIAAAIALVHRQFVLTGTRLGGDRLLGKGPYTNTRCQADQQLVEKLNATLDELRKAAREGNWDINWDPLDEATRLASTASSAGDYTEAVRQNCRAISHMMNELRHQQKKKLGATTINFNFRSVEELQ